jgi:PAS domain S-box-containing protein
MTKNIPSRKNTILRSLGISLLYFAAAQFGLSLDLDPHQITHYWPASGVALASVLFFDKRALTGITLGALATVIVVVLQQPLEPTFAMLFVAFVTIGALTVQPLIALTLLKRFTVGMPFWTHIKSFYRGVGILLVVSVIPASIGAGAIYMTGIMDSDNILSAWILWTMADFFGMVTIAPALYHLARHFDVTPRTSDQAPLYAIIAFSLACLSAVVIFIAVSNMEERALNQSMARDSTSITEAVDNSGRHKNSDVTILQDVNRDRTDGYWSAENTATGKNSSIITETGTALAQSLNMSKPLWASIATLIIGVIFTHIIFAHETNRKERRRTSAFHDAIVVSARQPFVHLDEKGIVLEWNNAAHQVFGWTLEQVRHRKLSETLIPARYKEAHENGMKRFQSTGEGLVIGNIVELEALCADGTELPIELLINAIQTEDGWHFFAFIYDISTRRSAEYELKAAHDKYTGLFEALPDAIITYDTVGNIEDVNDAAVALFGWSRDEIRNKNYETIVADQSKAYFLRMHNSAEAANLGEFYHTEQPVFATRRDGSEFPFEAIVNAHKTETGLKFISVIRDITEQAEALKRRESDQKIEILGELTGVLAHEFNNLLAIVIGNLDLAIAHEGDTPVNEIMQGRLKVAHDAAMRGTGVVKSLLAVGTDQPIPRDRFDIIPMVVDILPALQVEAGQDINLHTQGDDKPLLVNSNHSWLSEAIRNIVINAREAIVGSGQITISLKSAHSSSINNEKLALSSGDYVVIGVSDTGSGINASDVENAFDPFFSTKKSSGHKGIGLSMVSRMANQLDGGATIASKPGQGTTVQIFLPKANSNNLSTDSRYLNSVAARKVILVVDDQTEILTLAVSWLEKSGYSVKSTNKADVALNIIESSVPCIDLLITDMVMPSIDGASLSRFARKCNPHVEVLYMTGFLDHSQERSADTMDFPVLEKPFRKDKFLAAVRSIFDATEANKPS